MAWALAACAGLSIGQISQGGTCSPGYSSPAPNAACSPCGAGQYQPGQGASACVPCPVGSYQNASNASACLPCRAGTYQNATGASVCQPCRAGGYQNATGASACRLCPPGGFTGDIPSVACLPCPPGASQNASGRGACPPCPAGQYQNQSGATACLACAPGRYQKQSGATECAQCPPAMYQNASSQSACLGCTVSLYILGLTACSLCPAGEYHGSSMDTACTQCSPGVSFNPRAGATACAACTQCGGSEWFTRSCTPASDSTCAPCRVCAHGMYAAGSCERGSSMPPTPNSQDALCLPCEACPDGTFLSGGCVDNAHGECSNCTECENVLMQCTPLSDAVCGETANCRHAPRREVYAWLEPSYYCAQGQYLVGLNSSADAPTCARCPPGTYGPNGLWCEVCPGYKVPYFDGTQCVCHSGTAQNARDNCECGAGMEFEDAGCAPCAAGTFSDWALELRDDWWTQYKRCEPCPAGADSPAGASACEACPHGTYREANASAGCLACDVPGDFAEDPASGASCTPCNATCPPGFAPEPCPAYAGGDLFLCTACPDPPANASGTAGARASAVTACNWQCDAGFYQANASACAPCTAGDCPVPGYNRSACTPWRDSDCDQPCRDDRKPPFNSRWTSGCQWACNAGYTLQATDYLLWVEYSCVVAGSRLFAFWG